MTIKTLFHCFCIILYSTGKPAYLHQMDHFDWAPTKNMGQTRATLNQGTSGRYSGLKQRKRRADDVAAASALLELQQTASGLTNETDKSPLTLNMGMATQTSLSLSDITALEERIGQLERDNMALQSELSDTKKQLKSSGFDENDFKGNGSTRILRRTTLLGNFSCLV